MLKLRAMLLRLCRGAQVVLCKHRMGMICAASGDHRAATQLLAQSFSHYGGAVAQAGGPGSEGSEQVGYAWSHMLCMPSHCCVRCLQTLQLCGGGM
jgi:hypothetical protein